MSDDRSNELDVLVGEWKIKAEFPYSPEGHVVFEWMIGGRFLIERWEVPLPEAPDGLAIIGPAPEPGEYLQHYFDSRGVARIYRMTLADGEWKLWRETADFSPLEFKQRYVGRFGDDGRTITGAWEICHDDVTWEKDFNLSYEKVT